MKQIVRIFLGTLFLLPTTHAASFDCGKGSSRIEKMICSDPQLSKSDEELTALYSKTLKASRDPEMIKKQQRNWLVDERKRCGDVLCIRDAYLSRIRQLALDLLFACTDVPCVDRLFEGDIRRYLDDPYFALSAISKILVQGYYWETPKNLKDLQAALDHLPFPAMKQMLNDQQLVRQLVHTFYAASNYTYPPDYPADPDEKYSAERNHRSQILAQPLLKRIPSAVLNHALEDDDTLRMWFAWVSTNPSEEFNQYLQMVNSTTLHRHIPAVLEGMSTKARVHFAGGINEGANPVSQTNWGQLLARLPTTVDFAHSPPLLNKTETDLWPRLFAMGYRVRDLDADLGRWLSRSSIEQLKQHWETLLSANPALKREGIRLALKCYTQSGLSYGCGYSDISVAQEDLDKVKFLAQQGVVAPVLTLDPQIMRRSPANIIQQLVSMQAIEPLPVIEKARFVPVRINCQFTFNEAWERALSNRPVIHGDPEVFVDFVQLVEIPEQKACVMLAGGQQPAFQYSDEGNSTPSCPDPTDQREVWREVAGKVETFPLDRSPGNLLPLRDSVDGHLFYLSWSRGERCSPSPWATLMDWQQVNSQWVLKSLPDNHPAQRAFALQCDFASVEKCLGVKSPYRGNSQTPSDFINTHKKKEH